MRLRHLSHRTEPTNFPTIRRFIAFHGFHGRQQGARGDSRVILPAVDGNVAASTRIPFPTKIFASTLDNYPTAAR
jgi:hypothetical protein